MEHSVVSFISSSLGYIESTYVWNWLLLKDKTSSIYRNVELKATARDFFFSCSLSFWMNFAPYEYKNRFANKGAQFAPMGTPTDCWKTWPPLMSKSRVILNHMVFHIFWKLMIISQCHAFRYVHDLLENLSHHHCRWKAVTFKPILGGQEFTHIMPHLLWHKLGFCGFIRWVTPLNHLLWQARITDDL
jgi:hypothetical protein